MAIKILHRRDTAANFTSTNPTVNEGELCFETDTNKIKVGDGSTTWTSLPYITEQSFLDADHTKLDGIETSATADQTGAEIKTAYELEADTNAYTDAEKTQAALQTGTNTGDEIVALVADIDTGTDDVKYVSALGLKGSALQAKVDGIEASATADQTGAEIKTAYQAEANAFTDAQFTKLAGVEALADVTDTTNVVAALSAGTGVAISAGGEVSVTAVALTTVQSAVDETAHLALTAQEGDIVVRSDENKSYVHNGGNAATMADYTLLATPTDAVLSVDGNTGAVTAAQLKTSYESNADTNAFLDAEKTKLTGIEANATADQTAGEIEAIVSHDNLVDFVANEHIDWSLTNAANVHADNYTNTTYSVGDGGLSEINFTSADNIKLDGIEALADVTDATNVAAAGALMDSEVTNLADVKAFATTDYATAAQGTTADAALPKTGGTMTGVITVKGITETQTTKSASFTPVFTEGTIYSCTSAMTITMPTATAGKSFTIIHATGTSITWAGTIKWTGGTEPTKGAGIDIYTFISDGTSWYGMQGGTNFA